MSSTTLLFLEIDRRTVRTVYELYVTAIKRLQVTASKQVNDGLDCSHIPW